MEHEDYVRLKENIEYHMNKYYNQDAPEISDFDYDKLMVELKNAEKQHPEWITNDSPTQKIGGVVKRESGIKVTHDVPMLSIEDVFNKEDVTEWVEKVRSFCTDAKFSVETKIDGLSMTLRYEKKEDKGLTLVMAETRGDGFIGEDVTPNARMIKDVQKYIDLPYDSVELRGEVYMDHDRFESFNDHQKETGKKVAANARNLAAGTLRQLNTSITGERGLRMFVFNVQRGPAELMVSQVGALDLLSAKGVPVVYHKLCENADEVLSAIDEIGNIRGTLPYDIDGAVVKIDNISLRKDFPAGSKYASGHIAYKYPPEERIVVIDDIQVDVGRTGKLTFTGIFHDKETGGPARLCGTNVSRATLHNQDYIDEMSVGIGGEYKLYKSGEIIPKLNGCVKKPGKVFRSPERCPVCHESLVREDESADIKCVNPLCPAQITRTIAYFASINCMNIIGLGDTLVDSLVKEGFLSNYADIYDLREHRDELIDKGIVGKEKNTDKVLQAIERSKNNDPFRFLAGLGIRNVGKSTAQEIMKHYDDMMDLKDASVDELLQVPDIGETTAESIYDFFHKNSNIKMINDMVNRGVNTKVKKVNGSEKLKGITFVITGTLPDLGRKEAEEIGRASCRERV